jgi:hypothetical protein
MMVVLVPVSGELVGPPPPARFLEQQPGLLGSVRRDQHVEVSHRPICKRGIRGTGESAAFQEHHVDAMCRKSRDGLLEKPLERNGLKLRHHRELSPRRLDIRGEVVDTHPLQRPPHDRRGLFTLRQAAEVWPVELAVQ